jgi:hypothetical protein
MNHNFNPRQLRSELQELRSVIEVGLAVIPNGNFSRKYLPRVDQYERSFNRAIFDVLSSSLAHPEIAKKALQEPKGFENAFKSVCENSDFVRYVEATTKSVEATSGRYRIWQSKIIDTFGIAFKLPKFGDHD